MGSCPRGLCRGHPQSVVSHHVLLAPTCPIGATGDPSLWQKIPPVSLAPPGQDLSLLAASRHLEGARRWSGLCQAQPLLCTRQRVTESHGNPPLPAGVHCCQPAPRLHPGQDPLLLRPPWRGQDQHCPLHRPRPESRVLPLQRWGHDRRGRDQGAQVSPASPGLARPSLSGLVPPESASAFA